MKPTTATCVPAITSHHQQQQPDCQVTELEQYTRQVSLNRSLIHINFESYATPVVLYLYHKLYVLHVIDTHHTYQFCWIYTLYYRLW